MVTLHPFLADFLHWRTRRTHRPTTLCRACDHTAHARRQRSCQFLMGLRVECIKMEEQLLLLENPLLKIILFVDERSDWVNPILFYEREKCGEFHTFFPMLLEQTLKLFQYFRTGPDTFWYIVDNIKPYIEKQSTFRKCTRVGALIVATIYLQLIQNRYMFRSFTVLQCSRQHCLQPVASDVEVVGYL